ncbi:hypothetical protein NY08_2473 [Rhodococcus sp. B7740]|nr:hypothetical protein NY08_2473 [Rhodococcus sp. B7740]
MNASSRLESSLYRFADSMIISGSFALIAISNSALAGFFP